VTSTEPATPPTTAHGCFRATAHNRTPGPCGTSPSSTNPDPDRRAEPRGSPATQRERQRRPRRPIEPRHVIDGDRDFAAGGVGEDTITGRANADILTGGLGADILTGGLGDDNLIGHDGDDHLHGGPDTDTCRGGAGTDQQSTCELTLGMP
jgi:hypothetical protein